MSSGVLNLKIGLTLRGWQKEAEKKFNRFTTIVAHRRAGKTILNIYKQLKYLFTLDLPNVRKRAAYIAPTYAQAKEIVWGYYKDFLKDLPSTFVQFNESELKIKFMDGANGGVGTTISLYGAENYDNLRGIYLNHCILDEYQMISPKALSQVIMPTLKDHKGHLILTGTPNGKNDFYYRYLLGEDEEAKEWSSCLFDIYSTGVFSKEEITDIKNIEYKYKPEDYRQEYECSFEAAAKGSIFGKEISKLRADKRIMDKEYDPAYPVVAGLDFGLDGTAIWYIQKIGKQLIIIDFDFNIDNDIEQTGSLLLGKRYVYDHIILPHDGNQRSRIEKKKTARGRMEAFGFKVKVAKKPSLMDQISAARLLLGQCQITKRCADNRFTFESGVSAPLDALASYQFKTDDEGHTSAAEKHDHSSHIGAALRTLAVGLKGKFGDNFDVQTRSRYKYSEDKHGFRNSNKWNPYKLNRTKK